MKIIVKLVLLYVVFASWTNAFAITSWLTIPTIILLIITISYVIYLFCQKKTIKLELEKFHEDLLLLIILIFIIGISIILKNVKTLNYILAYLTTFVGGYLMIKDIIIKYIKLKDVMNANLIGVVIVGYFGAIDFFLQVTSNIKLQDSIPRSVKTDAIYTDLLFPRNYGFSEEPTYLAWYLNTLGLIAIWWFFSSIKVNCYIKIILVLPIIFTYITTFSGAGIPLLVFWSIFTFFFKGGGKEKIITIGLFTIAVTLATTIVESDFYELIEPIIKKATFQQEEDNDRGILWAVRIKDYIKSPILGLGLGYYSSVGEESPVNYFLFILLEMGFFPISVLFIFYGIIFSHIYKCNKKGSKVFLISFCAGVSHLLTQSLFFHPCLWLLIIIFNKFKNENSSVSTE